MNKRRIAKTIKQIRHNISCLYYIDNEIFNEEQLKQLNDISRFFTDMNIKLKEIK